MTAPAERSRALADAIAAGDAASLATLIDALRRDDGRIARSLGLSKQGRPRADRDRDALIVRLRKFHPGKTVAEAAREIASAWLRYEAAGWRADRLHPGNPYSADTPRAALWELLRAGHSAPSAATIRRRLAACAKTRLIYCARESATTDRPKPEGIAR